MICGKENYKYLGLFTNVLLWADPWAQGIQAAIGEIWRLTSAKRRKSVNISLLILVNRQGRGGVGGGELFTCFLFLTPVGREPMSQKEKISK